MGSNLLNQIEDASARGATVTFLGAGAPEVVSAGQLLEEGRRRAKGLRSGGGVGPGANVGLLGPTSRELVATLLGIWYLGGTAVMLPWPGTRITDMKPLRDRLRGHVTTADLALVVADRERGEVARTLGPPVVTLDELSGFTTEAAREEPTEDRALLQLTSGSTADPKAVIVTHAGLCANVDAIRARLEIDADRERFITWLPLYHDMGLIGLLLLPLSFGIDLVIADPGLFLRGPSRWMEWIAAYGGTFTCAPDAAYGVTARFLDGSGTPDLSSLRYALNGAEPIDPDTMAAFRAAGAPHGLDPNVFYCVFGMAEATLALTIPSPGNGARLDRVDGAGLEADGVARPVDEGASGARALPILGPPLEGIEARIVDPETGTEVAVRTLGELEVRGPSITPGYFRDPDATREVFRDDGWFRTGDQGYLADGAFVHTGRIRDLIVLMGRNISPAAIEHAAGRVDGVRTGNVIACSVPGGFAVIAESRSEETEGLHGAVARAVRDAVDAAPKDVVIIEPGTLPKTTSGKPRRAECGRRYLAGELATK